MRFKHLLYLSISFSPSLVIAQGVTEAITDYDGYWKSNSTSVNPVMPDNSHNLLAFRYEGILYSTGVNDALLDDSSEVYSAQEFQAIPVISLSGTPGPNTKIGLGQLYDGIDNGPSTPAPINNIPFYLTDGVRGLNLGTGSANLPAGTLDFSLTGLQEEAVGDGIPDILITQIAQPSAGTDSYEFLDASGNTVGNSVDISFDGVDSIGSWTADFYEASVTPMTLGASFTKTNRPIRLWTADLSEFGIDASNLGDIVTFRINLNGNSDVAFIAYNTTSIALPVIFGDLTSKVTSEKSVKVEWKTFSEVNNQYFDVERSMDGKTFFKIAEVAGAGTSNYENMYGFIDENAIEGDNYYRIRQVDIDGKSTYSNITMAFIRERVQAADISIYPNPAAEVVILKSAFKSVGKMTLTSADGRIVREELIEGGNATIDLSNLPKGTYLVTYETAIDRVTKKIVH